MRAIRPVRDPLATDNPTALRTTRTAAVTVTAALASTLVVATGAPADAAPSPRWGTLVSSNAHARTEAAAGVTQAMVELDWSWIEPRNGAWNSRALASYRRDVLTQKAAGRKVTLGLGIHFSPDWTYGLASARAVNEHGQRSEDLNTVYSWAVRRQMRQYITKVVRYIGPANIDTIRITSGGNGELMHGDDSYWASGHIGITALRTSQPAKGRPGTNATRAQHDAWARWYVKGLANVADDQMNTAHRARYRGSFELIMPGSGVRPSNWASQTGRHLPDGLLGLGVAWDKVAAQVHRRDKVYLHQSGVGDGSGAPGEQRCQPGDGGAALTSYRLDDWSSTRWLAKVARTYGFAGVSGENPGYGDSVPRSYYRDPNGLFRAATGLARSCGFRAFYWAHDDRLWDGTTPFAAYQVAIR